MHVTSRLGCACGKLRIEVEGAPVMAVECYCDSCRSAAARMSALPGAPQVAGEAGGTHYLMYRKDRVRFSSGAEQLGGFRLTPKSHTRRVIATCCNTPVFAEFQNGHWLSMYANLWPAAVRPAATERTMTSDLPEGTVLPADKVNSRTQSLRFMGRLMAAWVAMGFRVPKVDVPKEIAV